MVKRLSIALLVLLLLSPVSHGASIEHAYELFTRGLYKEALREAYDVWNQNMLDPRANFAIAHLIYETYHRDPISLYLFYAEYNNGIYNYTERMFAHSMTAILYSEPDTLLHIEAKFYNCESDLLAQRYAAAVVCFYENILVPYYKKTGFEDLSKRSTISYAKAIYGLRLYEETYQWLERGMDLLLDDPRRLRMAFDIINDSLTSLTNAELVRQRYGHLIEKYGHLERETYNGSTLTYGEWLYVELMDYLLDRRERAMAREVFEEFQKKYPEPVMTSEVRSIKNRL